MNSSEMIARGFDQRANLKAVGHVRLPGQRPPAGCFDFGGDTLDPIRVEIIHNHVGPGGSQGERDGPPRISACASDQGSLLG